MTHRIQRSISEPIRDLDALSYTDKWKGSDNGVITAWEVGRKLVKMKPELAKRANAGELPLGSWKGGVEKKLKSKQTKYGCLKYLAEWQGLRGEDLDIDLEKEVEVVCTRTGQSVTFTPNQSKYTLP